MRLPEGVEVYIESTDDKKKYKEYDILGPSATAEKYIEAQNGAEFEIVVRLLPSFKFYAATSMEIHIKIDDGSLVNRMYWWDIAEAKKLPVKVMTNFSYKNNGQWFPGKFNFAAFALDEDMVMESDEVAKQVAILGRIAISIQRGRLKKRSHQKEYKDDYVRSEKSDRETIKEHGISHFVRPGNPTALPGCPWNGDKFSVSKGKPGELIQCIFHYRSRFNLERLGIIPASPIIEPVAQPGPQTQAAVETDVAGATESTSPEESTSMEVAQRPIAHDRSLSGMAQSSEFKDDEATQNGASGHGTKPIKREHDERDKDGLDQIPTAKRPKFVVDLTEDDQPQPQAVRKPEIATRTNVEPANIKPETRQENSIIQMKGIPALAVTAVSDDEAMGPSAKIEASNVPQSSVPPTIARLEQDNVAMDNEEDLELELRRVAAERREIDIQLRLNKLRRSRS